MSHSRVDELFSDDNSASSQSNDDADSDNSSWNEGIKIKHKSRSSSRSKAKANKSRKKPFSVRRNKKGHFLPHAEAIKRHTAPKNKEKLSNYKIKMEDCVSDDVTSIMSDFNPPSFITRSKLRRKQFRRHKKTASSTSSALDSEGRKPKSEPILITLESSDDDTHSAVSSLPRRTARARGELMRKLKESDFEKCVLKGSDTSSSDSEKARRKKKAGKKQKIVIKLENIEKKPQILEPSLVFKKQKPLVIKKHQAKLKPHSFTPTYKRRFKIKQLQKRFERQNIERRVAPLRQTRVNKVNASILSKRTLRNNSSTTQEELLELKSERRKRRVQSDPKDIKDEAVKFDKKIEDNNSNLNSENHKPNDISEANVQNSENINTNEKLSETETNNSIPNKKDKEKIITDKDNEEIVNEKDYEEIPNKKDGDIQIKNEEEILNKKDQEISNKTEKEEVPIKTDKEENLNEDDNEKNQDDSYDDDKDEVIQKIKKRLGRPPLSHKMVRPVKKKKKIRMQPIPGMIRRKGRPRKIDSEKVGQPGSRTFFPMHPHTPFLQNSFCFEVDPKLAKCRECRIAITRSSKTMYNSYCRFMEYRKLCYNRNGVISNAGFSNPSDALPEHINLWLPSTEDPPKDLDGETAKSLLEHIGDQFCDLVEQEREALHHHIGLQQVITWKRVVQGVREMCDVCSTTIFNIHWVCPICGLAVCIDCYKVRKQGEVVVFDDGEQPKDRDEYNWLLCLSSANRIPHQQDNLVMAQIIPGTALWLMKDLLHRIRGELGIPSYCKCNPPQFSASDNLVSTGINKQLMSCVTKTFSAETTPSLLPEKNVLKPDTNYDDLDVEVSGSALRWLDNSNLISGNAHSNLRISDDYFNSFEDLVLLRGAGLINDSSQDTTESENEFSNFSLDDIIASVTNACSKDSKTSEKYNLKHFSQRYPQPKSGRDPLPIRIYTKIESEIAFPSAPHSWFCNGRLLFLHQANHKDNLTLFQEQWKRGQPIVVKSVDENLDMNLWHPDGFCRDFGEVKNDLVDCKTGNILKNLPMKKFWEGFENFGKRLTDESGEFMLLKLKDWPPGEDFSEKLPTRFNDLMNGLPLPEYTHRDGVLNLAGRLPSSFVRPDLGPKMYNAYGSALYPSKGTTNLHLDVSDAVNVMVYVGIPADGNAQIHIQEALKAIDEGGCDSLMRARVRDRGCKPGALWHIYNARDADKIRDMLTKLAIERGEKMEANTDPIHDQSWYIDAELRMRLYRDYGVEGYAIAQCLGDAVFIPAGAPHQVRNLHSCVKVAEDFVSPENIAHCFKLTQEFRHLSDTHTNHEDKLQIKNIIYHVVKDSLSHLATKEDIEEAGKTT